MRHAIRSIWWASLRVSWLLGLSDRASSIRFDTPNCGRDLTQGMFAAEIVKGTQDMGAHVAEIRRKGNEFQDGSSRSRFLTAKSQLARAWHPVIRDPLGNSLHFRLICGTGAVSVARLWVRSTCFQ